MTIGKSLAIRQTEVATPIEIVEGASEQARVLMDIVEKTQCYQVISGKKYLQVEAWETIGAFNRTHAETESINPIVKDNEIIGYQAHVQLWRDGVIVGGAVMPCYFTENCCKGREGEAKHKASMSAAQTFATSKAYRMNYSYVAILAGYAATPAEEMTEGEVIDKTEHWCGKHQTKFFKKGKMKSYAHPIEGTATADSVEWCHEHKEKPAQESSTAQKTDTPGPDLEQAERDSEELFPEGGTKGVSAEKPSPKEEEHVPGAVDMDWLKESIKGLHWSERTFRTWLVSTGKKHAWGAIDIKGTLTEIVGKLKPEQRDTICEEIQEMLDLR